ILEDVNLCRSFSHSELSCCWRSDEGGANQLVNSVSIPLCPGLSPPVKKAELDSPSPQEGSPRMGSFTQHHPLPPPFIHMLWTFCLSRCPHPSSSIHFPSSSYFAHGAIRYPPHLTQDPLKDLVSMACDPANQSPNSVTPSWMLV
uniref:Uncharacterized protein n=1 Tax=Cyprinodon variegatus TaxID=28743 RepID=A0A3Q2CKE4_CYPVA